MNKILILIIALAVILGGYFIFQSADDKQIKGKNAEEIKNSEQKISASKQADEVGQSKPQVKSEKNLAFVALANANKVALIDIDTKQVSEIFEASNNPHGVVVSQKYIFTSSTKMGPKEMAMVGTAGGGQSAETMSEMPGMDAETMALHHPPVKDAEGKVKKVGSDVIRVIDRQSGAMVKEINVSGGSHHLAISNDDSKVAVIVPSKNGVAIIDTKTLAQIDFFETGKVSNYAVFSADNNKLFVSNSGGDTISIINLNTKQKKEVAIKSLPDHIVLGKAGKFLYTANGASNSVSVVDIEQAQEIAKIKVGKVPHGIAISTDGKKVYIANSESDSVSVIDTVSRQVIKNINIGQEVAHLETTPKGNELWVNSESAKAIFVVDTQTDEIKSQIDLGYEPHQIGF